MSAPVIERPTTTTDRADAASNGRVLSPARPHQPGGLAGRLLTSGEQRVQDDPTLRASTDMIRTWAEASKVCVRPLLRKVTDRDTGDTSTVPLPCGSTREHVCPACAYKARGLRQQQCREGWHLEHEPHPHDQATSDTNQEATDPKDPTMDNDPDELEDGSSNEESKGQRVRSTRRRDDAVALPHVPQEDRTVGRTWTGNDGTVYRPSMFVTLTLPSYGRISPGTGTPVDPDRYDYRRAAMDAVLLPKLFSRWVENLRRSAGYTVQYFAVVEPQRRLAPHMHLALRGAIPRKLLQQVTKATYLQTWWPAFDRVVYSDDPTEMAGGAGGVGVPCWADGAYRDPHTGMALPTWQEALDDIDAQHQAGATPTPAHVARFGTQVDIKGITAPSKDADRAIRYLTKYLTKSIADTYTPGTTSPDADADFDFDAGDPRDHHGHSGYEHGADDDDPRGFGSGPARWDAASVRATAIRARYEAHIDRLHQEVRWLPCSPECANWLRYGVQPKDPCAGLVPGRCPKRAHDRENLGYSGRRVQVSRKWSGKTLAEHKADRATVIRETLAAAGMSAPEVDRLAVDQVLDDGLPRFVWEDVPTTQDDYAMAILTSVRERDRWREQYEHAKNHPLPDTASNPVDGAAGIGPPDLAPPGGGCANPISSEREPVDLDDERGEDDG
ncbi:replication initiator [Aquipuribacter sp. MA13-6]|uniref:replication initiator n=1 Tax=unclassified Aquipuribacter TaxID=2635084 RepID=UPI003EEF267A